MNITSAANKTEIWGYDDEISRDTRKYIRKDIGKSCSDFYTLSSLYLTNYMEDKERLAFNELMNIHTKQKKAGEEELKQNAKNPEDKKQIKTKKLSNCVPKIARRVNSTCWRGPQPVGSTEILTELKNSGIETIVDLTHNPDYEKDVKKTGLNYIAISFLDEYFEPPFMDKNSYIKDKMPPGGKDEDKKFFSEEYDKKLKNVLQQQFIPLIKAMQNNNVYIGCSFGTWRTDDGITVADCFNSKNRKMPDINKNIQLIIIENIYNSLSADDKKQIGFDKDYEQCFKNSLKQAKTTIAS